MQPTVFGKHVYREVRFKNLRQIWAMVRDRGNSAEEISDGLPTKGRVSRNSPRHSLMDDYSRLWISAAHCMRGVGLTAHVSMRIKP